MQPIALFIYRKIDVLNFFAYTSWAHLGAASEFLVNHFKPLNPPILILSLPRSGSSWAGIILGNAANALYLREPITQNWLAANQKDVVGYIDPQNPPKLYKLFADQAFLLC